MFPTTLTRMTAAFGLLFAPALLAAQSGTPGPLQGDVTRAQIEAQVKMVFDRADTNKDNFMSRDEFGKRMGVVLNRTPPGAPNAPSKEQAQRMLDAAIAAFNAVDADHDGKLNRVEAGSRALAQFDLLDANHDGVVTVAEKAAARKQAVPIGPVGPNGPAAGAKTPGR